MAANEIEIRVTKFIKEEETDCRQCSLCDEKIFSKMHVLYFQLQCEGRKPMPKQPLYSFCESCFGSINF